jgi:hypothetical protein
MKLKDKIKLNEYIKLYSHRGSFGYSTTPNHEGIVTKIKGLNANAYELTFDNGSVGYLTWTTKVER